MVGLGTRSTIERVESGNSQPKAARASALPDGQRTAGQHRQRADRDTARERVRARRGLAPRLGRQGLAGP
jgi:hypothetical protein